MHLNTPLGRASAKPLGHLLHVQEQFFCPGQSHCLCSVACLTQKGLGLKKTKHSLFCVACLTQNLKSQCRIIFTMFCEACLDTNSQKSVPYYIECTKSLYRKLLRT